MVGYTDMKIFHRFRFVILGTLLGSPAFLIQTRAQGSSRPVSPSGTQSPTARQGSKTALGRVIATPVNALMSPEVHADKTVTLRFRAPGATQVQVVGEITQGKGPLAMTRDVEGIWTTTLGPLPPEIWSYNFQVQGVDVTDPSNPAVKPVPPGQSMSSFVEVPDDNSSFYDARPVPHGEVRMILYESKVMGVQRWLWVYTPPDYDKSDKTYPVLYLLHGNGEAQSGWVMNGRANVILDNLLAENKAQPMIVVMPQGHALQAAGVAPLVRVSGETEMYSPKFSPDLIEDIIPLIEQKFRVMHGPNDRAIAGLSMGGGQALNIGLHHPELFHYILGFSAAVGEPFLAPSEVLKDTQDPTILNKEIRLLWFSCGHQDFVLQGNRDFAQVLDDRGITHTYRETEGAHVWSVWRHNLNDAVPLLFVKTSADQASDLPSVSEQRANQRRIYQEQLANDWPNLARYHEANQNLSSLVKRKYRVVFMGDSITDIWAQDSATFFPGKDYIGRGIGGQITPQMVLRFQQDVIALKPAVVVINGGTNDIAGNTGPSTLTMIEDNLKSMTELAVSNKIKVVLASVTPVYDYPWKPGLQPTGKVIALNAWMKDYCSHGNCVFADYFSAMSDDHHGMREGLVRTAYTLLHWDIASWSLLQKEQLARLFTNGIE
jgi:enterochelin esterase-like enzyme